MRPSQPGSEVLAVSPPAGVLDGIGSSLARDHPVFDCEAVEDLVAGLVAVGAVGEDGVDAHARLAGTQGGDFEGRHVGWVAGVDLVKDDQPFGGVGDRRFSRTPSASGVCPAGSGGRRGRPTRRVSLASRRRR